MNMWHTQGAVVDRVPLSVKAAGALIVVFGGGLSLMLAAALLLLSFINVDPTLDRSGYANLVLLLAALAMVVHLVSGIGAFMGHPVGRWLGLAVVLGWIVFLGSAALVVRDWTQLPTMVGLAMALFCAYALAFRWRTNRSP